MSNSSNIAKLLLRVSIGVLILYHGIYKIIHGVSGVKSYLVVAGFPEEFAYGVYLGEVVAPLFIILGLYARLASIVLGVNMLMAIYLAYGFSFATTKYGGLLIESPLLFLLLCCVIILLGSGKYAVNNK